tara:strand:- start:67 stop:999 length:933 start_codon:yes stop_codon:yes gene_type:complete
MKTDLHIHSKNSDGALGQEMIVDIYTSSGDVIAFGDHNTSELDSLATKKADEKGVIIIPGVAEISTDISEDKKIHLVGYGMTQLEAELEDFFQRYSKEKTEQAKKRCVESTRNPLKLKSGAQISISFEEMQEYFPGKPTYFWNDMFTILADKFNHSRRREENPFMELQDARGLLLGLKETYEKFKDSCIGLEKHLWRTDHPIKHLPINKVKELIKNSGGLICLPHPGQYKLRKKEIQEINPDALEVYSPKNNIHTLPIGYYLWVAQDLRLLISGGSDAHFTNDYKNLGKVNQGTSIPTDRKELTILQHLL